MKEMKTLKFSNQEEAYEIVDAQAREQLLNHTHSWNELENRPFGSEVTEILPETTIEVTSTELPIATEIELLEGSTYTVHWNGTEYTCIAQKWEIDGATAGIVVGDLSVATTGESTTGEPFLIVDISSEFAAEVGGIPTLLAVFDESTSVTVSISVPTIKKLDSKYLDLEWTPSSKPATRVEVFPETTVNATGDTIPLTEEFMASAENKVPYIVTWNGTEYTCTGLFMGSQFAIGNLYLFNLGSFPNTGEPFLFFTTGQNLIISYTDEGSATFKIDRGYYDTLPYEFAPANYTITTDIPANQHANNDGQLSQAEYVLKHGGKVFATVDGRDVEILSMIADTVDNYHNFSWRDRINGNIYTMPGSETDWKAQTPAVDRIDILLRHAHSGFDDVGYDDGTPPQKFRFTVDENGNLMSSNEDGTNQKKYLTSIPEEYVTEDELTAKGYLTSIPEEYVTETELNNTLDSKGYLTQHQSLADYAKTSEVDTKIANLVNSAPEKLNTLDELAAALGDDENFANTVTTELGKKINSSDLASWAKSSTKPTYTASEIGAAEVEHTHDEYAIKDSPTFTGEFTHGTRGVNSVVGDNSFVSGYNAIASGSRSHAEGTGTIAYGQNSHAEGAGARNSITITIKANSTNVSYTGTNPIVNSLIEYNANIRKVISVDINNKTFVIDSAFSDVDDYDNVIAYLYIYGALGNTSHAEGSHTVASGAYSHAEGNNTIASGHASHAEGSHTVASGAYSHTEGNETTAFGEYQHVQGKYNIPDADASGNILNTYAHIVGNGEKIITGENEGYTITKSNAHTLDWSGNAWFAGDVYVGSTSGTNKDTGSKKLATEEYVNTKIDGIPSADMSSYYTKTEVDNLQLITVEDIDAICGGAISYAEDVMF